MKAYTCNVPDIRDPGWLRFRAFPGHWRKLFIEDQGVCGQPWNTQHEHASSALMSADTHACVCTYTYIHTRMLSYPA